MRIDLPILMSSSMILSTMHDLKHETRRTRSLQKINERPDHYKFCGFDGSNDKKGRLVALFEPFGFDEVATITSIACPYGAPGGKLWVRENWAVGKGYDDLKPAAIPFIQLSHVNKWYAADGPYPDHAGKGRPSIHMPKVISRIKLEVLHIGMERLQEITPGGAIREGVDRMNNGGHMIYRHYLKDKWGPSPVHSFETLWKKINGMESWELNPWVWVIQFKKLSN